MCGFLPCHEVSSGLARALILQIVEQTSSSEQDPACCKRSGLALRQSTRDRIKPMG